MKTASGHEIVVAWNDKALDVVFTVNPDPKKSLWEEGCISLTPKEARELGEYFLIMANTCEKYISKSDSSNA
jgi:hypothetical protein